MLNRSRIHLAALAFALVTIPTPAIAAADIAPPPPRPDADITVDPTVDWADFSTVVAHGAARCVGGGEASIRGDTKITAYPGGSVGTGSFAFGIHLWSTDNPTIPCDGEWHPWRNRQTTGQLYNEPILPGETGDSAVELRVPDSHWLTTGNSPVTVGLPG